MSIDFVPDGRIVPAVESADKVAEYLDRHARNLSLVLAESLKSDCGIDPETLKATHQSDQALYYELKKHDATIEGAAELQGVRTLRALYNNARKGIHGEDGAVILPQDDPFMHRVDQQMYRYIGIFVAESRLALPEYNNLPDDKIMQICKIGSYTVLRGNDEGTPFVFYATAVDQA